jgi:hypothetical protein
LQKPYRRALTEEDRFNNPAKAPVRFVDFFATLPDKRRLISMYGDSGIAGVL